MDVVTKYYNSSKIPLFNRKNVIRYYLEPIGLYDNPPSREYSNDPTPLNPKDENKYFEALHFIKYRLDRAVQENKNVQFWENIYVVLRNRITSASTGLVFMSMKLTSYLLSVDPHDNVDMLKSVGFVALMRAVDRFDPWKGYRFCTYATRSILHAYNNSARKFNRPPMLDVTEVDVPEKIEDDQESFLLDRIFSAMEKANLSEREKKILDRRYFKQLILHDVAEEFDLSKERVRQIQMIALEKIKEVLDKDMALYVH